ncbi:MAG: chromosome partitioning protein [Paracoccus sp. (in: a-proteobacteria)]
MTARHTTPQPDAPSFVSPAPSRRASRRAAREDQQIAGRFSVLRTRLLQEMSRQRWRRLGVCPITDGAGATYVAANLALATSRLPHSDVLLVDLALGHPSLAMQMGLPGDFRFISYLRGEDLDPDEFVGRVEGEKNLRCFTAGRPVAGGAELLQDEVTRERIDQLVTGSGCNLAIFDLSPVLGTDEGLAGLPVMDAVLLVADGKAGKGRQVADCQRLLADMPPLLGIVLNKAELSR